MNSSEISWCCSKLSCQWKYHTWNTGTEIITVSSSVSTYFGVSSAETSITLAGCSGNTYLELIKILHIVKYVNEKEDVERSACWWLFSYLAAFLVFPTKKIMIFLWRKYRKKYLSLFLYSPSRTFPLLSKKNLKRPKKKRKKDVSFQSPIISGYFLI